MLKQAWNFFLTWWAKTGYLRTFFSLVGCWIRLYLCILHSLSVSRILMTWGGHFLLNMNISLKVFGHAWCASDTPVLLIISRCTCDTPFNASDRSHFISCLLDVLEWRSNSYWVHGFIWVRVRIQWFWLYNLVFHFID